MILFFRTNNLNIRKPCINFSELYQAQMPPLKNAFLFLSVEQSRSNKFNSITHCRNNVLFLLFTAMTFLQVIGAVAKFQRSPFGLTMNN